MVATDFVAFALQIRGQCFCVLNGQGVDDAGLASKLVGQELGQFFDAGVVRRRLGSDL